MPTDVVMPQMGESIAEGTIVRWIKKVGDTVERDEPLFEISTDKVDAEIPSPAAGVLSEIRAKEGETVAVNTVVAVIGSEVSSFSPSNTAEHAPESPRANQSTREESVGRRESSSIGGRRDDERGASPVVRRLAAEHGVDISKISGTGAGGRVTKEDVLSYVGQVGHDRREQMSPMRKKIAEHMVLSQRTSAHVHSVFEVDFSRVLKSRGDLSPLAFIVKAVCEGLRAVPVVNASVDGDSIVYHQDLNIGIAVALDWGLIVPVITNAGEKDVAAIGVAINDLAARARSKQLKPEEVAGGTFTITNPGSLGTLVGLPIINQPQAAILAVGHIEKRAVVRDDQIVVRPMAYLALGYDHRIIDGAVADRFLAHVKKTLE